MNILVICVNAENGGGEKILKMSCEEYEKDSFNNYYVCTSLVKIENKKNIINLQYLNIKKSYLHRIYFDLFEVRKLIKKYSIDKIISLQNIGIFYKGLPQSLYIQQALPFSIERYSIFNNFKYWFYQNIFFNIMKKSLRYVSEVIVQTKWMKESINQRCDYDLDKITVKEVNVINKYNYHFDNNEYHNTFFYPTSNEEYKRYDLIFLALEELKNKNVRFVLTLSKQDLSDECLDIYNKYPNNFELVGYLDEESLYKYYASSILVFPSNIESLGLPLLEAKSVGTKIIASDIDTSKEVLEDYDNVIFFKKNSYKQLANIIEVLIDERK